MDKKYLTLEEIQLLFQQRQMEYSSNPQLQKFVEPISRGFVDILDEFQNNNLKIYQKIVNDLVHTWVELDENKLSLDRVEHLQKVFRFTMQIEGHCGYKPEQ